MYDIFQIQGLRYAEICGKRRLFHDLTKNFPEKSKNLKPKRAMRVLHLLYFLFGSRFPKLFFKVAVLKFLRTTPPCDFSKYAISHVFPEKFIESLQIVQKIRRLSPSMLTIFISFLGFLTFPCCRETNEISR